MWALARRALNAANQAQQAADDAADEASQANDTVSQKVSKAGDTITGNLGVSGTVTVGSGPGVTLTYQPGAANALLLDGQILSAHDALYAFANNMQSNGTLVDTGESGQDVGVPRWALDDLTSPKRVKWMWPIPAEWDQVAVRFGWAKETAASGSVKWQFAYRLVYPFTADNLNTGAVTNVDLGAIAVPGTQFAQQYQIPVQISALAVSDGAFGSKPFMLCSLSRLGQDATDTFNAGVVSVYVATLTRTA